MPSPEAARRLRERVEETYGVLRLVGINSHEVSKLERLYQEGNLYKPEVQSIVDSLRARARLVIEKSGLNPDEYIEPAPIPESGSTYPLPTATIGVLALLGTTDRQLEALDFDAPMKLRTGQAWRELPDEYQQ